MGFAQRINAEAAPGEDRAVYLRAGRVPFWYLWLGPDRLGSGRTGGSRVETRAWVSGASSDARRVLGLTALRNITANLVRFRRALGF